jgi:zinc/manganese transport system substrate-binding protein
MGIILRRGVAALAVGLLATVALGPARSAAAGSRLTVVVGENFWGSIVGQLAGNRASVTSVITNPATDPHDYEPRASDARRVAGARYVVLNGIGYDPWLRRLLDADPESSRRVLDVGRLLHLQAGDNPHQWYDPASVDKVAAQVSADLAVLDPADAAYFRNRLTTFETKTLAPYHALIGQIRDQYAGVAIGASESVVTPLAKALGLKVLTPQSFLNAMSEGADPTAGDRVTIEQQISGHAIRVFVYNSQNATRDVRAVVADAKKAHIRVTTVTETLAPTHATFQSWQVAQLRRLQQALAQG